MSLWTKPLRYQRGGATTRAIMHLQNSFTPCLAVIVALLLVAAVQSQNGTITEEDRHAEIVFEDTFHLVFPRKRLERFQRCLCNTSVSACSLEYKKRGRSKFRSWYYEFGYEIISQRPEQTSFPDTDSYGNTTFLCHPGLFAPMSDTLMCSRLADSYRRCSNPKTPCRIVHVELSEFKSCSTKCVNVGWLGYEVTFENFTGNQEFRDGACGDSSSATEGTTATTQDPSTSDEGKQEKRCNDGDIYIVIIAAVGWALFVVVVVAIGTFVFYRRWKLKRKKIEAEIKQSDLKFKTLTAPSVSVSKERRDHEENGVVLAIPAHQSRAEGYDVCESYIEPDDLYTVIEDGQSSRVERSTQREKATMETKLCGRSLLGGVPEIPAEHKTESTDLSGRQDNVKIRKGVNRAVTQDTERKETDTESVDGYTRLKTGRADQDQGVTDSFMATYNAPVQSPDEAEVMKTHQNLESGKEAADDYSRVKAGRADQNNDVTDSFLATYNKSGPGSQREGEQHPGVDGEQHDAEEGPYYLLEDNSSETASRKFDKGTEVGDNTLALDYSTLRDSTGAKEGPSKPVKDSSYGEDPDSQVDSGMDSGLPSPNDPYNTARPISGE